jgi:hypothetical protein
LVESFDHHILVVSSKRLSKISNEGTVLWHKYPGFSEARCIAKDMVNGDGYIVGDQHTASFTVFKLDVEGNFVWENSYAEAYSNLGPYDILQESNGDFYLVGWKFSTLKMKSDGTKIWYKQVGDPDILYSFGCNIFKRGNNFVISGYTQNRHGYDTGQTQKEDGYIVEIDENGNTVNDLWVGGEDYDYIIGAYNVDETHIVIGGFTGGDPNPPVTYNDYWIKKLIF